MDGMAGPMSGGEDKLNRKLHEHKECVSFPNGTLPLAGSLSGYPNETSADISLARIESHGQA